MSKSFRFWVRCTTVATLTVLMTFNPAWAGRGLMRFMKRSQSSNCVVETNCCPTPVPCVSTPICCDSGPVVMTPVIESAAGCCEPVPVMSAPAMESNWAPIDIIPTPKMDESSSIGQVIAPASNPKSELSPSDVLKSIAPKVPEIVKPVQPLTPAAEVDSPFSKPEVQTPPAVEPAAPVDNDPFGAQSNPPAATTPAEKVPAEISADPFGTAQPSELPAKPATNDPFGAPALEAPARPAELCLQS